MLSSFLRNLEDLFELDANDLSGSESLAELPDWNSLLFVSLIAMVDEEYEVTLAPKEVLECKDLTALADLIQRQVDGRQAA